MTTDTYAEQMGYWADSAAYWMERDDLEGVLLAFAVQKHIKPHEATPVQWEA